MTKSRAAIASVSVLGLLAAACSAELEDEAPTGYSSEAVTSCGPSLERYPVRGPHNNGWDGEASVFSCGTERSNTDYYTRPGDTNHANGHFGNDIFAARGTPVVAARAGVIDEVSVTSVGGNNVTLRDACGWYTYYAHLDAFAPGLRAGTPVAAGAVLGVVGDTGSARGTLPHLHFSVFPGNYYAGIDPHPLLRAVEANACAAVIRTSCGDVAKRRGYADARCEHAGNGACRGTGPRTDDCDHCCDATVLPPAETGASCGDLARAHGFVNAQCEVNGNRACAGSGARTSDCDRCCDAVSAPPATTSLSCGDLAAHYAWTGAACEHAGNGACGGRGTTTSDCEHCCSR